MPKSKVEPPVVSHKYDAEYCTLSVTVTITGRPADYESLHTAATIESRCVESAVDEKFDKRSKFLRKKVSETMGKLMRDYDKGVAASYRQASRKG